MFYITIVVNCLVSISIVCLPENWTTHPLQTAQNLMTHPLSAPAHRPPPPPYFLTPSLSSLHVKIDVLNVPNRIQTN